MTEAEAKTMLIGVAARQPAVILDIAALLSKRQQPQPENPKVARHQVVASVINVLLLTPHYFNSLRLEMGLVVMDPLTMHIHQTYRNDVFVHQAEKLEDTGKAMSMLQYVLWICGRLQKDDRRTVPVCCVKVIRNISPSLSGHYTGYGW